MGNNPQGDTVTDLIREIQATVAQAGYLLVTPKLLTEFTRSHLELQALEAAGVDNSDAYESVNWAQVVNRTNQRIRTIGLLQARMLGLTGEQAAVHADAFLLEHGSDSDG